jgi:hypothetical protein
MGSSLGYHVASGQGAGRMRRYAPNVYALVVVCARCIVIVELRAVISTRLDPRYDLSRRHDLLTNEHR